MAIKQKIQFLADLDISGIKSGVNQLQAQLNNFSLPKTLDKSLSRTFEQLRDELKNFETLSMQDSIDKTGMNALVSSYTKIDKLIKKIGVDSKELGSLGIEKLLPADSLEKINKINSSLETLQSLLNFKVSNQNQIQTMGQQAIAAQEEIKKLNEELAELNKKNEQNVANQTASRARIQELRDRRSTLEKAQEEFRKPRGVNSQEYASLQKKIEKARTDLALLENRLQKAEVEVTKAESSRKSTHKDANIDIAKSNREQADIKVRAKQQELEEMESRARALRSQKTDGTELKAYKDNAAQLVKINQELAKAEVEEKQFGAAVAATNKEISKKTSEISKQQASLNNIQTELDKLKTAGIDYDQLAKVKQAIQELSGTEVETDDLEELQQILNNLKSEEIQQTSDNFKEYKNTLDNVGDQAEETGRQVEKTEKSFEELDKQAGEVASLKTRIQQFFKLDNAIQLVKRTIRSAYETVKELDKAMTETAVVTDFTVGDMWAQLPEYTKRANELGVTTQAAYEAATLYYQQGLSTNEVMAMSNETLKMARIAGLDAAEATDRMTNAIRGFNMEINEMNAQRIDDVYSRLAAISASDVDEISIAMTKVASLAHNANMEFETTAAFLAQIIETTRESPETAGTALKTVVARFSEVKKLVDEGTLRGSDEEGQVVDVNKVSSALRTAGIDLNKYFLGEVGLDDIFMELASKWDSLSTMQQRYIATQAAGSRQQSRFIALMSDYARTQELVGEAYNANGAAAKQFEKTQDSLQSKLAKLKNAWDEFSMGIANSSVIKGVVTALTGLLDLVNKITGAFGEGASGVLKFIAAFSALRGLKTLFKDGGIAQGLLGKISEGPIGNLLGIGGGASASIKTAGVSLKTDVIEAGHIFKEEVVAAGRLEKEGAIEENFIEEEGAVTENTIEQTGAVQENAIEEAGAVQEDIIETTGETLGAEIEVAGETAGAKLSADKSGILSKTVPALFPSTGGLSATAIFGFAAALIALETGAVALQDYIASGKAQVDHAERVVKKQEKQVETSSDLVKKQREAYESYIENEKIAKTASGQQKADAEANMAEAIEILYSIDPNNIQTLGNEFVVNKGYAKDRIETLEEQQATEEATLAFDKARLALTQEQVALGQRYYLEIDNEAGSITQGQAFARAYSGSIWEGTKHQVDPSKSYEQLQYEAQLYNFGKEREAKQYAAQSRSEITNGAAILLDNIVQDKDIISSISSAYAEMIDADSFKNKSVDQIQSELFQLSEIALDKNGKLILDVINGSYEDSITSGELNTAFSKLNENYKAALIKLLNTDENGIAQILEDATTKLSEQQLSFRKDIFRKTAKTGFSNEASLSRIMDTLSISQLKQFEKFIDQWSIYSEDSSSRLISEALAKPDAFTEGTDLNKFLSSITDNSILTYAALNKYKNTSGPYQDIAASLLQDQQFERSKMAQNFFMSEEYESLNEQISTFIEQNEKITSANINELANSSKTLSTIINENIISVDGLAKAITALEKGKVTIVDLNERVINLYESFNTTADSISRAKSFIETFDTGEDFGDAISFLDDAAKKMHEILYETGLTGNLDAYRAFFENPPEESDIEGWKTALTTFEEVIGRGGLDFWTKSLGFGYDEKTNLLDMNIQGFKESGATNYKDYVKSLLPEGTNFSDEFIDLMLRNAKGHDAGAFKEIAAIELDNMIQAFGYEQPTKADIQAIADGYGFTPQEILDAYNKKWKFGQEALNYEDLADSFRQTYTKISDINKEVRDKAFEGMRARGVSDYGAGTGAQYLSNDEILKYLGVDSTGAFSVDKLRVTIGELVPEVKNGEISADEWLQEEFFKDGPVKLPVEFEVTKKKEDGSYGIEKVSTEVEVSSLQDYIAAVQEIKYYTQQDQTFASAKEYASDLVTILKDLNNIEGIGQINIDLTTAQGQAEELNKALSETIYKDINFNVPSNITIGDGTTSIPLSINVAAKGGYVKSAAHGGSILTPGPALTGEEAPEIVWNKNRGYAYLAGKNGPEINNLQPGDRVFNGKQTKDILKRSKIGSFADTDYYSGTYWIPNPQKTSGGGGGGNSSSKAKDEEWKNTLDWLYNLMEDIAELERIQTILSDKHDRYLEDISKTGRDLYKITNDQLNNLYTQRDNYQEAVTRRLQEMREQITENELSNYVWWNGQDNTIEIDWDAINEITDKDQFEKVSDLVSKAETIQGQIDEAQDALWEIEGQIDELEKRYLQEFIDLQKRVYDAVVNSYQQQIDALSSLNETINESNDKVLNSLQKEIELQRQIRDNTDTEKNIQEMEARLAFLRRDTTGANDAEIRSLEKQLEEARRDYADTLIDQAIDKLQESNSEASEERQKQIELLTEQLDYWKEIGALWPEVARLLDEGINGEGSLIRGSTLEKILQEAEGWKAMSEQQREVWSNELITAVNQAGAYIIKMSEGFENLSEGIWALIPESSIPAGERKYATGGLVTSTGHAWLDGTRAEPEYVLNARQTDAFLKLAEVLPSMFNGNGSVTNNLGGNVYVELNMSVGEIGSDYDVDRLVERVKEDIYNAGSYRNVNAVSFMR